MQFAGADRMASQLTSQLLKFVFIAGAMAIFARGASAQSLEPPPFDVINRHQVNMMSGTAAPKFTDLSIGGELGLTHWITTANSDFVNYEAGYGPMGPRHKFYGRITRTVFYKPSENIDNWIIVMRAGSFDGSHDFKINPGCTMDSAGNVTSFNTFVSQTGDPRHILEYTDNKKGLVWTRPDGTRVVYDEQFGGPPGCFTPQWTGDLQGWGISRIEYPNGFTIFGGGADRQLEVHTNSGYQFTYIYVSRQEVASDYGAPQASQPWAVSAADPHWGSNVPSYVIAINNAIDYCAPRQSGFFASATDACPGLTQTWPFVSYSWPVGMPRVAYLTDRTTTFTVKDAMGRTTKYIHKPFRSTIASSTERYIPRLYQVQSAGSDVADVTYDYSTESAGAIGAAGWIPVYIPGPPARLKTSTRNVTDVGGYLLGSPYGQGGMSVNSGPGQSGALRIYTNHSYGTFQIDMWDKLILLEQHPSNRLTSVIRSTDGVRVDYGYDDRFNINQIKENDVVVSSAFYPSTCSVATRKTCNKPTWVKDAAGNRTDYEYDANSGQVTHVMMPADKNGVRPEIRYEYQPKYAYYKRSSGGAIQQSDTPIYLLTKEKKCLTSVMGPMSSCAAGAADAVLTEYDYGPAGVGNNLSLRGIAVTAYADNVSQTRRTCYSYDSYGNRISETKPQAGLTTCY